MITIAPGSKEYLVLKMIDVLPSPDALTTMVGTAPTFDVIRADEAETVILASQSASIATGDPMLVLCLIDAQIPAIFPAEGDYNLFLEFTNAPEVPRLGPFRFRVDD
jgi:hypothetical protein